MALDKRILQALPKNDQASIAFIADSMRYSRTADPRDLEGRGYLHMAVINNSVSSVVLQLIENGCDVWARTRPVRPGTAGLLPIELAAQYNLSNTPQLAQALLDSMRMSAADKKEYHRVLHSSYTMACRAGNRPVVGVLASELERNGMQAEPIEAVMLGMRRGRSWTMPITHSLDSAQRAFFGLLRDASRNFGAQKKQPRKVY